MLDPVPGFLEYLAGVKNFSDNTVTAYRRDLAHFAGFLERSGIDNLARVDHRTLRAFLTDQLERYSRSTVARRCACLRSFFHYLAITGQLPKDPAFTLTCKVKARRLPHCLTQDEAVKLMEGDCPIRDRAIIELLYATGIRVSELCGLRLGDVNLEAGTLRVIGKGDRERVVLAGEPALRALEAYMETRPNGSEIVFIGSRGGPLLSRQVHRIVERQARATLGRGVSPHDLRHSFATHLIANGADLRTVQELLGHKNITNTQIYTHLARAEVRSVYDRSHPHA